MKESNMNAFENSPLVKFKNEPEWFKKALLKACTRDSEGKIGHVEYMELDENLFKTRPIVTTLKYLRAVVPDSVDPTDDKIEVEAQHINDDTCIILTINDKEEYVEPLSGFKVLDSGIQGYSPEEICGFSIEKETYLILASCDGGFFPFGYVTEEILALWEKETVPYKNELKVHLEKIKKRTENNFGESYLGTDEIEAILNHPKNKVH